MLSLSLLAYIAFVVTTWLIFRATKVVPNPIILGDKIQGMRLGQIIVNTARKLNVSDGNLHGWLFYVENEDLERYIKAFLEKR